MKPLNRIAPLLFLSLASLLTPRLHATAVAMVDVNVQVKANDTIADDPQARLQIVLPRGGAGSAQLVVKADKPLDSLKASCSALSAKGGERLPAGAVLVRYATRLFDAGPNNFHDFPWVAIARPTFDGLPETLVPGETVQPVWVTVSVPVETKAGEYTGTVTVSGAGVERSLPLSVTVMDYVSPKPGEQRMWVSMTQSPDSVAERYRVAPWSDAHFKLLEKSVGLMSQVGNNVVYVPVLTKTAMGEATGLIYFRKSGDTYVPDFTAFDRYMAMYIRQCGLPRRVVVNAWDAAFSSEKTTQLNLSVARGDGTFESVALPLYADDQKAMWKSVFDGVYERAAKMGIAKDCISVGTSWDGHPQKEHVAFLAALYPDLTWAQFTHGYGGTQGKARYIELPDGPLAHGRAGEKTKDYFLRGLGMPMPQANKTVRLNTQRDIHDDMAAAWMFRLLHDCSVDGDISGLARVGLDCWGIPASDQEGDRFRADRRNRPKVYGVVGRYGSNYGRLYRHPTWAVTIAGPDGAIATARFEAMREGYQHAEARLACEAVLKGGRLSATERDKVLAAVRGIHAMEYAPNDKGGSSSRRVPAPDWQQAVRNLYEGATLAQGRAAAK